MNLSDYLSLNGVGEIEGNSGQFPKETEVLAKLSSSPSIKNILEIGFNAGHSANTFLSSNPNVNVISFDLGEHNYTPLGKKYIDEHYPLRHKLILGDSTQTIPTFINENPDKKFDIIFIDGGHVADIPKKDIINCKKLAHSHTIIIMDDVMYDTEHSYTVDVTKAWKEAISWNIVKELAHYDNTSKLTGFSIGLYIF